MTARRSASKRISIECSEKLPSRNETIQEQKMKNCMLISQVKLKSFTSMSLNSQAMTKSKVRARRKAATASLAHELLPLEVLQILERLFFNVPQNVTAFAHERISEFCSSLLFVVLDDHIHSHMILMVPLTRSRLFPLRADDVSTLDLTETPECMDGPVWYKHTPAVRQTYFFSSCWLET